jgi:hypothetical protein
VAYTAVCGCLQCAVSYIRAAGCPVWGHVRASVSGIQRSACPNRIMAIGVAASASAARIRRGFAGVMVSLRAPRHRGRSVHMPGADIVAVAAHSCVACRSQEIAASQMDIVRPDLDIGRNLTRQWVPVLVASITSRTNRR